MEANKYTYYNKYTCKTLKYGGISLLVWGAIRADFYRILIQCPPRLGSQEYQDVLRIGLLALYITIVCHSTFLYIFNKNPGTKLSFFCKTELLATGFHQLWHTWITKMCASLVIGLHNHQTSISMSICLEPPCKNAYKTNLLIKI